VRPFDGLVLAVGPLVVPGESACYRCVEHRRAANSDLGDDHDAVEAAELRAATPVALGAVAAGLAASIAVAWLAREDRSLPGRLVAVAHEVVPIVEAHHVLRVPRCRACGDRRDCAVAAPWFKEER
jgi:ribosomal protein S12 methylthiotransferase accessory factor